MEQWKITALILCGFGIFKEFRPSEPFFTQYLIDFKEIPVEDIIHIAFPVWTYSYLATLAIVFLVTDFLRYRSVIVLEGIFYVITWVLIIWGKDLKALIFVEVCYGIVCSTEVAYFTYIYAKVDKKHYRKVTSYTYSAIFVGRFLAGVVAQLLVSFNLMDYHQLNYLSLAGVSVAVIFSLFLPPVEQSIYFHRDVHQITSTQDELENPVSPDILNRTKNLTFREKVKNTGVYLFQDFKDAYSSSYVLKWSIWWAVASAGHLQVLNFIQALWETIVNTSGSKADTDLYNGAVEALHTLLSAILALLVGRLKISWSSWGEGFLALVSLAQGASLYWLSSTDNLYIAYACYILYRLLYQVVITIASAEVAQKITEDSYALIFGINTFIALVIQTLLTLAVADDVGLALKERPQFRVYGGYHGVLGVFFVIVAISSMVKNIIVRPKGDFKKESSNPLNENSSANIVPAE